VVGRVTGRFQCGLVSLSEDLTFYWKFCGVVQTKASLVLCRELQLLKSIVFRVEDYGVSYKLSNNVSMHYWDV